MTHLDPDPLYVADPLSVEEDERLSDADKLRLLALWFDMWDRPETDRQAILADPRNPGRNEVQRDLRRIAGLLDDAYPRLVVVGGPRSTLSLTIPLVLLCAVVGALFVAWVVTR